MKVDILAFGAHPDDIEISAGGTVAKQVRLGYKVGLIDLTQGDLGTRGSIAQRRKEADDAAKVLGVSFRKNLCMADGFFENNKSNQLKVAAEIRKHKPDWLLANALEDRHPDHGKGGDLVRTAAFLAGLRMIELKDEQTGELLEAHRPQMILHYIQFQSLKPQVILSFDQDEMDQKMSSILKYESQFFDPNSKEPATVISSKGFLNSIRYRSEDMGRLIGKSYGEGFYSSQDLGIEDITHLKGVR